MIIRHIFQDARERVTRERERERDSHSHTGVQMTNGDDNSRDDLILKLIFRFMRKLAIELIIAPIPYLMKQ